MTAIEIAVEIDDLDTSNYLEASSVDLQLTFRNRKDKLIYATEQKQYLINHEDNRIQKLRESFVIPGSITDEECDPFKSALFRDTYVYLTARLLMRTDQGFRTIIISDYLIFQSRKFERELVQTQTQDFPYFKGNIYIESQKIERNYFMFKKQMAFRIALYKFSGFYLMLSSDNPETGSTYIYSSTQQFPYIIMEPSQLYLPMVREDEKILLSFYGACDELPNHQFLLYTFNIQKDTEGVYLVQPFKINGNFNQLLTYYLDKFEILTNNQEDSPLKQKLYNLRNFYSFQFNNMFKSDPMFVELDLGAREKEIKYLKEFDFLSEEMARLSKEKTAVDKTLIQIADNIDMSLFLRIPISSFKANKSPMQSRSQSRNKSQEISVRSAPVVDDLLEKKMQVYKKQCEIHEFLKEDKFLTEVQTDFVDFISTSRAQLYGLQKDMVQSNELMNSAFQCLSNCYGIAFFPLENEIIKINGDVPEYIDKKFDIDLTNNTKQLVSSAFIPQTDILVCLSTEKIFSCYILDSSMKDKEQISINLNDYNSPRIFKYLRYKNVSDIFIVDKIGDLSTGNINYFKSEADVQQQCCELPDYVFDYTSNQLMLTGNSLEAILSDFQISNRQLFAYQLYCEICQQRTQQNFYQMNLPIFCTNQLVPDSLLQIDQLSMKQSIYFFLFQIKQYLDFKRYYENKFVVSISSDNAKKLNFVMNEFFKFDCKCDYLKILEFDNFAENTFTVKQFNEIFQKLSQDNFKYAFEQELQLEPEQDQNIQLIISKLIDSSNYQFTINQIVQFLVYLFEKFGKVIKPLEFRNNFVICIEAQDMNQLYIEVTYADDSKLISYFREDKAILFKHNCIESYQIQSLLLKVEKQSYKLFQNGYFLDRHQYLFTENKQIKYCLKQHELESEIHYLFYISAQNSSPRLFYKSDDYEMWGESMFLAQSICGLRYAFHKLSYPMTQNMTVDICIDQNKKIQINPSNDGLLLGIPSIVVISQNEPKASETVLLEDTQKQQFTEIFGVKPFEGTNKFSFDQNHIINQTDSAINEYTISLLTSFYQFAKNQSNIQICIIMYKNRDNVYSVSNQPLSDQNAQIEANFQQQLDVFSYLNGLPQMFTFNNVDLQMKYFLSLFNTQDGSIQNEQFSFSEFNVCFGTQDCFLAEIIKGHPCVVVDVSGCLKTTYYCEMKISKKVNALLDQFFEIQTESVIADSKEYEKHLVEKLGQEKIDNITKAIIDNQKLFFGEDFQLFLEGRLISLKQSKQKEFLKFVLLSLSESQLTSNQLVQSVIFCCQSHIILNFTEMLKNRRFIKATPEDMKSMKTLFCRKLQFKINDDAFLSPQTLDDYFMNNLDVLEESEQILDYLLKSDKHYVDDLFDYFIIEFEKVIMLTPNSLEISLKEKSSRNESENFQLLLGWLISIDKQVKILKERKFLNLPDETLPIIIEYLCNISLNKYNVSSFNEVKQFRQLEDFLRNDVILNSNIIIQRLFDQQQSMFQHVIPNLKLALQLLLQQSQYCSSFTESEIQSFLDQTQQNVNVLYQLSFGSIYLLQQYSDHLNKRQGSLLEEQQSNIISVIVKQNKINTQLSVVYNSVELEDEMFAHFPIQLLYQIWQNLYNQTECQRITQTRVYNTQLLFKDIPHLDLNVNSLLVQQYHILAQSVFKMLLIVLKFQNQVKNRLVFEMAEPQSVQILKQLVLTISTTITFPELEQSQEITSYILELEYLFLNNFDPLQLLKCVQSMLVDVQTNEYLNKLFQANFFHPFKFIQKQLESLDQKYQKLFTIVSQQEQEDITMNQVVQSIVMIHYVLFKKQLQLQSRISITVQSQQFQPLTNNMNALFKLSVQSLDIAEFEDNCELQIDSQSICQQINKLFRIENFQQLSSEMMYSHNDCYILTENQDIQKILLDKFTDPKKKLLMTFNEQFQLLCEIIYSALLFQQQQQNRKFIPLSYFDMATIPLYFKNMGVDINYTDEKDEKWLEDVIAKQKRGAAMNQVMQSLLTADVKQLLAIMKVKIQNSTSLIDEKFKTLQEPWLLEFIKDGVLKARKKEILNSNQCIQVVLFLVDAYHDHVLYLQNRSHINLNVNDSTVVATLISKLPDIRLSSISNIFKPLDIEDQIYDQNQFDQVIPLCLKYLKDFRNLLMLFDEKIRDPNSYFISVLQNHVDDKEKAFLRQVRSCIELNKQVTQNQVVQYLIYVIYVLKQKDVDLQQRYFIKVPDVEWEDLIFIIDEKYPFRLSKIAKLDMKELENQMTHQFFGQELKDMIISLIEPMSDGQQAIFEFRTSRLQEFFNSWILGQIEATRSKLSNTFNRLLTKDIQIFTDNDLCQVFLAAVLSMNVIRRYRQQRQFLKINEQQLRNAITILEKNDILQNSSSITNIMQLEDYIFDQKLDDKCKLLLNNILSGSPQQMQAYFGEEIHYQKEYIQDILKLDPESNKIVHLYQTSTANDITQTLLYVLVSLNEYSMLLSNRVYAKQFSPYAVAQLSKLLNLPQEKVQNYSNLSEAAKSFDNAVIECRQQKNVSIIVSDIIKTGYFDHFQYYFVKQIVNNSQADIDVGDFTFVISALEQQITMNDNQKNQFLLIITTQLLNIRIKIDNSRIIPIPEESIRQLMQLHFVDWQFNDALRKFTKCVNINQVFIEFYKKEQMIKFLDITACNYEDDFDIQLYFTKIQSIELSTFLKRTYDLYKQKNFQDLTENSVLQLANFIAFTFMTKQVLQLDHTSYTNEIQVVLFIISGNFNFITKSLKQNEILQQLKELDKDLLVQYTQFFVDADRVSNLFSRDISNHEDILLQKAELLPERNYLHKLLSKVFHQQLQKISLIQKVDFIFFAIGVLSQQIVSINTALQYSQTEIMQIMRHLTIRMQVDVYANCCPENIQELLKYIIFNDIKGRNLTLVSCYNIIAKSAILAERDGVDPYIQKFQTKQLLTLEEASKLILNIAFVQLTTKPKEKIDLKFTQQQLLLVKQWIDIFGFNTDRVTNGNNCVQLLVDDQVIYDKMAQPLLQNKDIYIGNVFVTIEQINNCFSSPFVCSRGPASMFVQNNQSKFLKNEIDRYSGAIIIAAFFARLKITFLRIPFSFREVSLVQQYFERQQIYWPEVIIDVEGLEELLDKKFPSCQLDGLIKEMLSGNHFLGYHDNMNDFIDKIIKKEFGELAGMFDELLQQFRQGKLSDRRRSVVLCVLVMKVLINHCPQGNFIQPILPRIAKTDEAQMI